MSARAAVQAWESLVRFHRKATTSMDASLRERTGHTLDEYDALHQLAVHRRPMRMGDLAEQLLIASSSCNRLVGKLIEQQLVSRLQGASDRREVFVQLTPDGRRLYRRMAAIHTRDIEALVAEHLSDDQTRTLASMSDELGTDPGNPD